MNAMAVATAVAASQVTLLTHLPSDHGYISKHFATFRLLIRFSICTSILRACNYQLRSLPTGETDD